MLLLALTVGILTGTALGLAMSPPYPELPVVGLVLGLLTASLALCWRRRWIRIAILLLLAAVLSGVRAQVELVSLTTSAVPDGVSAVRGVVTEVPRQAGRATSFILEVDSVAMAGNWQPWVGRIEARTFGYAPSEGDRVDITGEPQILVDVPGLPRATLLRRRRVTQEIDVERLRILQAAPPDYGGWRPTAIRDWMERRIAKHLDAPNGALAAGLLLGSRAGISSDLRSQFAQTGTSHIVAVSGFNVVIVSSFVSLIAVRYIGIRWGAVVALFAIAAYTLIVGAPPSAVRAAIMGGGAFIARLVGRPSDSLGGLVSAGALMALVDPLVVQDLGFQLSLLATAGLILLLPRALPRRRWARVAMGLVLTPLAAQIATLPLTLHVFHSVSLVSILANVSIALLLPMAMALSALLIVLADVVPLAESVAAGAWAATEAILAVVRWCASLPGASISTGSFPAWAALASYLALAVWVVLRSPEIVLAPRARSVLLVTPPLILLLTMVAFAHDYRPVDRLRGDLFEQGEVMIAQSPSGQTVVIGTTLSPPVLLGAVTNRLPPWKQTVDLVIVTDNTAAAWRGVAAIEERFAIDVLIAPPGGNLPTIRSGHVVLAEPGVRVDLGGKAEIYIPPGDQIPSSTRDVPIGFTFGSTGLRFSSGTAQWPEDDTGRAWLTMTRRQAGSRRHSSIALGPMVLPWDLGSTIKTAESLSELDPRPAIEPIGFSSDGEQLTLEWFGCDGPAIPCSATARAPVGP